MRLDRLLGILTILLQNNRVSAPQLAEKFEVSRRTIGRDVDTLCAAGIPIVTHQGAGGGISIADGYKLDKSVLTKDELSGIVAAIKGLGSVSRPSNTERTLDKLGANSIISLREPIVIDLASHYKGQLTEKIEMIKGAILTGHVVEFDYYYEKGEARRYVEPYLVIFQWSSWYLYGFCLDRRDWRLFKLTRLWRVDVTGKAFSARELPEGWRNHNHHFSDEIRLVALFDPSVKHLLIDAYGLGCYSEESGGLRFEFGFTNRGYLVSWLLGFGGKVKVLEPISIVEDLCDAASAIIEKYNGCKNICN